MKKIRITSGTYGYNDGKHIIPKDRRSGVFALEDKEAERLIALGVAEYAETSHGFKEMPEEPNIPKETPNDADDLNYDLNSSVADLRRIGKKVGLTFAVGTTKADMIASLNEFFERETESDETALDISAEEPVE